MIQRITFCYAGQEPLRSATGTSGEPAISLPSLSALRARALTCEAAACSVASERLGASRATSSSNSAMRRAAAGSSGLLVLAEELASCVVGETAPENSATGMRATLGGGSALPMPETGSTPPCSVARGVATPRARPLRSRAFCKGVTWAYVGEGWCIVA